jgi:hypothetical protein
MEDQKTSIFALFLHHVTDLRFYNDRDVFINTVGSA